MASYLQTVENVYDQAARSPDSGLCCTKSPVWQLPDLHIPPVMLEMNYGCGSTVSPRDLKTNDTVLYVGVGGGLEALQFAYFTRRPGGVIAVDPVASMRDKARMNFELAAKVNPWFQSEFVHVLDGSALALPVQSQSVTVAAQNCLFNVFKESDLRIALKEVFRVLKPGGWFATSDPITPVALPDEFRHDDVARARCLSGCQLFEEYVAAMTDAGFGRVEVRARFPYRLLTPEEYPGLTKRILLESVEIVAFKTPETVDGPAIFTGRTATYVGPNESLVDESGAVFARGIPVEVSDVAAKRIERQLNMVVTAPTFQARSGGCC